MSDSLLVERFLKNQGTVVQELGRHHLSDVPLLMEKISGAGSSANWCNVRKSRLIESFFVNVPVPPVTLFEVKWGAYEVIDGMNRLEAVRSFVLDELVLEGLTECPELNGHRFSTLPGPLAKALERRHLSTITVLAEDHVDQEGLRKLLAQRLQGK